MTFCNNVVVPLPPGTTGQTAQGHTVPVVGMAPCLGHDCAEWVTIKQGKEGPYAICSDRENQSRRGCKRRMYGNAKDIVEQTPEAFLALSEAVEAQFGMPTTIKAYMTSLWAPLIQEMDN